MRLPESLTLLAVIVACTVLVALGKMSAWALIVPFTFIDWRLGVKR
jgi:hypothetical protein